MKTTFVSIASRISFVVIILSALLLGANVQAGEPTNKGGVTAYEKFAYSLYPTANKLSFRFNFANENDTKTLLKIYDLKGNLIYTDYLGNAKEGKREYAMDELGKGEYVVEVVNGDFRTRTKLNVGVSKHNEFSFYSSSKLHENHFTVAYSNANSAVSLNIRDEEGKLVYAENGIAEQNFARKYSLENLPKGNYTLSVNHAEQTFTQVYQVNK